MVLSKKLRENESDVGELFSYQMMMLIKHTAGMCKGSNAEIILTFPTKKNYFYCTIEQRRTSLQKANCKYRFLLVFGILV